MTADIKPETYKLEYPFKMKWAPEAGEPFEVYPGVFWLNMPLPFSLGRINLWMLRDDTSGSEKWTIVDTGMYGDKGKSTWLQVFDNFCSSNSVERIFITHYHPDHLGLAEWLSSHCECPVLISRGEYDMYSTIRGRDPQTLSEAIDAFVTMSGSGKEQRDLLQQMGSPMQNKTLPAERCRFIDASFKITIGEIDWSIIPGNGHSPEHLCLYAEKAKLFISGDQAIPRISSNVSLFHDSVSDNPLLDWINSCERLRDEVAKDVLVLPSHQEPFVGLDKRMQKLIDGHHKQLKLLEDKLSEKENAGASAAECTKILFPRKLESFDTIMATGETLANLRYLERENKVRVDTNPNGFAQFYTD